MESTFSSPKLSSLIVGYSIPYGKVIPEAVAEVVGGTVVFTCYSTTTPKWTHEGLILLSGDIGPKLFLVKVKKTDTGTYTCSGTFPDHIRFKAEGFLQVTDSKYTHTNNNIKKKRLGREGYEDWWDITLSYLGD